MLASPTIVPRAILFDLDETILTEGHRGTILGIIAEEFARELAPHGPAEVAAKLDAAFDAFWGVSPGARATRLAGGRGIRHIRETVISECLVRIGIGSPTLAKVLCDRFMELRAESTRLFPGARETVVALRQRGVRLALITNGAADVQRAKLERFNLTALFDHIQIEGEQGFGKPEEIAYTHAMSALATVPGETWMVGDSLEWEVAAPQRLGIFAIWHDHRRHGLPVGTAIKPNRIIQSVTELMVRA